MKLLLDTQIILWAVVNHPRLPAAYARQFSAPGTDLYVSSVSVWEVAIKRALGKLDVPEDLFDRVRQAGVLPLPITWAHAAHTETLPPLHKDPFDRMLIAQAQLEGMTLATADGEIARYDVARL
ncbi:twitching motility protein PilT [Jannaschia pagri]|uniref:Twitching motility protein PilT n=1 Tax=Jannaschia pagri TaxID=2829797 RepID=A0ABQ4NRN8_9RHOB|nr:MULTISPECIES: type II toxin-antitoxin system VapC family toxin [unclassified Jannaschia]GIT93255.1 twitching motility protein PilT [Jannaschia sp. AI_61]GIT97078.1 twitching motility protein PilT [Jannaschia sp. AI_62]